MKLYAGGGIELMEKVPVGGKMVAISRASEKWNGTFSNLFLSLFPINQTIAWTIRDRFAPRFASAR